MEKLGVVISGAFIIFLLHIGLALVKQKKGTNYGVFCFAGKRFFFVYDVIVKQKKYKRSTDHYCWGRGSWEPKERERENRKESGRQREGKGRELQRENVQDPQTQAL